jgi:hypothetical protein
MDSWHASMDAEDAFRAAQGAVAKIDARDMGELELKACLSTVYDAVHLARGRSAVIAFSVALNLISLRMAGRHESAHREGRTRATAPAATPEPAIYYKTPVTPEEAFQAIGRLRKEARDEIDKLIRFLDETDNHMEREPGDESELEPSLGSFDRMTDQSKAWRQSAGELCFSIDAEQDDADNEDSDPAEESEASGIADQDGLETDVPVGLPSKRTFILSTFVYEQVPFRDWQNIGDGLSV